MTNPTKIEFNKYLGLKLSPFGTDLTQTSKVLLRSNYNPHTILFSIPFMKLVKQFISNYHAYFELIFKASQHGFENFHRCCDNKGPTIIICKA